MIQSKLAGSNEDEDDNYHVSVDAASLMALSLPVTGNYREEPYKRLVDEAIDSLALKFLNRPASNHNMMAVATCCNSWGEKRTIERHQHRPWKIKPLSRKSKAKITSKAALRSAILGQEPEDPAAPWLVAFPRGQVDCTYDADRNYQLRFEVGFP